MSSTSQSSGADLKRFSAGETIMEYEPWIWSFEWDSRKRFCAHCFKPSIALQPCKACEQYHYCNEDCQLANWEKEHKYECALLKRIGTVREEVEPLYSLSTSTKDTLALREIDSGFSAKALMLLKVIQKREEGCKEQTSEYQGINSVIKILELFPCDPNDNDLTESSFKLLWNVHFKKLMSDVLLCGTSTTNETEVMPESLVVALLNRIQWNMRPMTDYTDKLKPAQCFAAGLFRGIIARDANPVCLYHNAVEVFQGRTLRIIALDDISVGALSDVRFCDLESLDSAAVSYQRRERSHRKNGRQCSCRQCSEEFDAEINPLKCSKARCPERIPSDERALMPCPRCGTVNEGRLRVITTLRKKHESIIQEIETHQTKGHSYKASMYKQLKLWREVGELVDSDILRPEAQLMLAYGWNVAWNNVRSDRYDEACIIYKQMIVCIRALYPRYHPHRARHLRDIERFTNSWCMWAVFQPDSHEECLRAAVRAFPMAIDCLKESSDIYAKLYGKESNTASCATREMEERQSLLTKARQDLFNMMW